MLNPNQEFVDSLFAEMEYHSQIRLTNPWSVSWKQDSGDISFQPGFEFHQWISVFLFCFRVQVKTENNLVLDNGGVPKPATMNLIFI